MDLPYRSKLYKKNEIKTFPHFSNFPGHRTDRVMNLLCTLLREDKCAIYIKITIATGTSDATMPVAHEDSSSNGPMR
jgi:hypothetical protein